MPESEAPPPASTVTDALRRFPYGLYAVGVHGDEDPSAFTANWVTQVSSEPPMIAVAVESDAPSLDAMLGAGRFSLTLYGESQRRQAALLARPSRRVPEKLRDVAHRLHASGLPLIEGGVAWLVCEVRSSTETGDHILVVGEVADAALPSGDDAESPLTMAQAGFRYG